MNKNFLIPTLTLLILIMSACTTPDFTQSPLYSEGRTNPNLSCTVYNGCYMGYQSNNLGGQESITVIVVGWQPPQNQYGSINYESMDGSRWTTLENALVDSLSATGERKVIMRVPVSNYSIAVNSLDGNADVNGMIFPTTWYYPFSVGTGELVLPITLNTNFETTFNPGNSAYTGMKLRKKNPTSNITEPLLIDEDSAIRPIIPTICPQIAPTSPDWCINGTIILRGLDSNGCQLPPTCII